VALAFQDEDEFKSINEQKPFSEYNELNVTWTVPEAEGVVPV
jgi:hypothetical protein